LNIQLGEAEEHFLNLIWENEPISSMDLVDLCKKEMNWTKATTFTVIRRLCSKEIIENVNSVVRSRLSRAELQALRSEKFIEKNFDSSLPAFLVSFVSRQKLSREDIDRIRELIDSIGKDTKDGDRK